MSSGFERRPLNVRCKPTAELLIAHAVRALLFDSPAAELGRYAEHISLRSYGLGLQSIV